MIRLNRTTEYGLIALRHMSLKKDASRTSAREIATHYGLPFEIMAKTLQRLKDMGLITSTQGARGGYLLAPSLETFHLADFIAQMEGDTRVVACAESGGCEYKPRCEIQHVMNGLHQRVHGFLSQIRLTEFIQSGLLQKEGTASHESA